MQLGIVFMQMAPIAFALAVVDLMVAAIRYVPRCSQQNPVRFLQIIPLPTYLLTGLLPASVVPIRWPGVMVLAAVAAAVVSVIRAGAVTLLLSR